MNTLICVGVALILLMSRGFAEVPLRKGDVFELRVAGVPADAAAEWALQYSVSDDGKIKLPYIGELAAAGNTSTQLARAIERRLVAEKIFTQPTVLVSVEDKRFVTVGGEVRTPGAVLWSHDLSLWAAVSRAGGVNEWGKKVRVTREGKSQTFDLKKKDRDERENPKLLPGDEVEVL